MSRNAIKSGRQVIIRCATQEVGTNEIRSKFTRSLEAQTVKDFLQATHVHHSTPLKGTHTCQRHELDYTLHKKRKSGGCACAESPTREMARVKTPRRA